MNRTVIAAYLAVILCGQLVAQQSAVPGVSVSGRTGTESAPQPARAQNAQPQATQPASPQAAPATQTSSAPKKKRSAAKKKAPQPATEAAVPTPAAPVPAATAAPQLPPTLMNQPPVSPTVTMRNGLLTIDAPNSTLSDILNGVRQATGAVLEGVSPSDRVAVRLGPGSPRDVIAALLQGTPYDYLILGSERDPKAVTHIMLTQSTSSAEATPPQQPAGVSPPPAPAPPPPPDFFPDQDNVVPGTVTEGEPSQPPPLPQQPVNPNQPWLTLPQQQPPQQQPPQPQP